MVHTDCHHRNKRHRTNQQRGPYLQCNISPSNRCVSISNGGYQQMALDEAGRSHLSDCLRHLPGVRLYV